MHTSTPECQVFTSNCLLATDNWASNGHQQPEVLIRPPHLWAPPSPVFPISKWQLQTRQKKTLESIGFFLCRSVSDGGFTFTMYPGCTHPSAPPPAGAVGDPTTSGKDSGSSCPALLSLTVCSLCGRQGAPVPTSVCSLPASSPKVTVDHRPRCSF